MLRNDFYTVGKIEKEGLSIKTSLYLTVDHPLYQGHFPARPVVPGVCMLQMIKELTELATGRALQLSTARTMKFLLPIVPADTPTLQVGITWQMPDPSSVEINATLLKDNSPCFKFSGIFRIVD
ncbi:MAG TPA: hypothetical protein VKQ52_07010 [Puia sp.]|nr:hypothetical protein [Puia sp.]